jgi:hypothetical protein
MKTLQRVLSFIDEPPLKLEGKTKSCPKPDRLTYQSEAKPRRIGLLTSTNWLEIPPEGKNRYEVKSHMKKDRWTQAPRSKRNYRTRDPNNY